MNQHLSRILENSLSSNDCSYFTYSTLVLILRNTFLLTLMNKTTFDFFIIIFNFFVLGFQISTLTFPKMRKKLLENETYSLTILSISVFTHILTTFEYSLAHKEFVGPLMGCEINCLFFGLTKNMFNNYKKVIIFLFVLIYLSIRVDSKNGWFQTLPAILIIIFFNCLHDYKKNQKNEKSKGPKIRLAESKERNITRNEISLNPSTNFDLPTDIKELKTDYIQEDLDSVKLLNFESLLHNEILSSLNSGIVFIDSNLSLRYANPYIHTVFESGHPLEIEEKLMNLEENKKYSAAFLGASATHKEFKKLRAVFSNKISSIFETESSEFSLQKLKIKTNTFVNHCCTEEMFASNIKSKKNSRYNDENTLSRGKKKMHTMVQQENSEVKKLVSIKSGSKHQNKYSLNTNNELLRNKFSTIIKNRNLKFYLKKMLDNNLNEDSSLKTLNYTMGGLQKSNDNIFYEQQAPHVMYATINVSGVEKILKISMIPHFLNECKGFVIAIKFIDEEKNVYDKELGTEAKNKFLNSLCHELRTPMNCMTNMLAIIQEKFYDLHIHIDYMDYINMAVASSQLLLSVINDFVDYFSITCDGFHLNNQKFDLMHCLKECFQLFQFLSNRKNLFLNLEWDEMIPNVIISDEKRIKQIVFNLLNNAIKFTTHGFITLKAVLKPNNYIQISVIDTGIGINPEQFPNLAKFQTDSHEDERVIAGFGLYISNFLANFLGPDHFDNKGLFLFSEIGKGSKFSFLIKNMTAGSSAGLDCDLELDLVTGSEKGSIEDFQKSHIFGPDLSAFKTSIKNSLNEVQNSYNDCKCPKVMIVDDNDFNRAVIEQYLNGFNIRWDQAVNGVDAITKIDLYLSFSDIENEKEEKKDDDAAKNTNNKQQRHFCNSCKFYDCILMDIEMPLKGGIETTKILMDKFKKNNIYCNIVGISAFSDKETIEKALSAGMIAFYQKPIKKEIIKEIIFKFF